jgi:sugar lactone lactonase YvrE
LLLAASAASAADHYRKTEWIAGSAMHGVHGLVFDATGRLFGASLTGYSIYEIDPRSGRVRTAVGPPQGNADDVAVGPDGLMVWTAGAFGSVFARTPGGAVRTIATGLPGVNSVNFSPDGRLFVTRIFAGDALYEIDPAGVKPPRQIADKLGGLNGFEVTADGKLYGPLFFRHKLVTVDVNSGAVEDFADGFQVPAAVNLDGRGNLYAVDIASGELTRIRLADHDRKVIAKLEPPLDNLAIDKRGWVCVSNPAWNRITEINPENGAMREVVGGRLSSPGGLALGRVGDREALFIADFWANRVASTETGSLTTWERPKGVASTANVAFGGEFYALSSIWPIGGVIVARRDDNRAVKTIPLGAPYGMAFLPDGALLVADYKSGSVVRIEPGDSRERSTLASGLAGPVGLALADKHSVYVSEWDAGRLSRIPLHGGAATVVASGLNRPEGVAVDSSGTLIVAETARNRLLRIDPLTGKRTVVASGIAMGLVGGPDMPAPFLFSGVAISANGTIYADSDVSNAIFRIAPR